MASINLAGLEYVISITAVEGVVYLRVYKLVGSWVTPYNVFN